MTRHEDVIVDLDKTRDGGSATAGELIDGHMVYSDQSDCSEWILDFDYPVNPLPMNGSHGNPRAHARKVREVRTLARRFANLAGIPPLGHAEIRLIWYVRKAGRRDPINLSALVKALVDGLVDHGVTVDDTAEFVKTPSALIVLVDPAKNPQAWMELSIKRWEPVR